MKAVLLIFTFTIFWGAGLLFVVQPMFGRFLLPLLGGAPAVWNACMVFFQATLLAGYGYAHLLSTRLSVKRQVLVHAGLLIVALVSLPIAIPLGWTPPVDANPVGWLLLTATMVVGLPFLVVSATSPLLQRWLSLTRHPAARDPYFLYAASNVGSLLALLGYPLIVEPRLGLTRQSHWWAVGYGVLVLAIVACGLLTLRWSRLAGEPVEPTATVTVDHTATPSPAWRERGVWLVLAFVPSSLMLSVTHYITMDLAAVPLLWVIPLALYLGTFSLAFSRQRWLSLDGSARLLRLALVMMVITLAMRASEPIGLLVMLHLFGLFAAAMVCHQQLAARRPPPRFLTQFYFWMALGGVLGGAFNALLAPVVFESVVEYPIGLVAVCLLLPPARRPGGERWANLTDLAWPVGLAVVCGLLVYAGSRFPALVNHVGGRLLLYGLPATLCFSFSRYRVRFALGLVVLLLVGQRRVWQDHRVLFAERSFFGIHRVEVVPCENVRRLFHGTTVHGIQQMDDARRGEPLAYYTRSGPLGQIMERSAAAGHRQIAVVGLGAGGVSCYATAGQRWTYYEIDPVVKRVASDPKFFTYLSDAASQPKIVLGDARVTLRSAPDGSYHLLVLDAYNSDAIPLHLVTREALALYESKLQTGGLLAWHMTNRHLDLEPVLAGLAADGGWLCYVRDDTELPRADLARGKAPSRWAVMARDRTDLGGLIEDPRWRPARPRPGMRLWTDDYANLFSVLRWRDP